MTDHPGTTGGTEPRTDEELRETFDAQRAHGGSMAPGLVDATGHQIVEDPPQDSADAPGPPTDPAQG